MMNVSFPLMHWGWPIGFSFIYLATLFVGWPSSSQRATRPSWLKPAVIVHNVILAVYSAYVFCRTAPSLLEMAYSMDFNEFILKAYRGKQWSEFAFFGWTFYVSKAYEFVDTWILMVKGQKPSILQIFHHAGAVLAMWLLTVTENPATWIFVVLNSLIHTLMYSYYTLTALGCRPAWKIFMTVLQILQFIIGMSFSTAYIAVEGALNRTQVLAVVFNQCYVSVVLYLFCEFFVSSYIVRRRGHEAKTKSDAKPAIKEA